ncbi:MAG: integration host factor subunit beta [Candidatus Kapabacteria bacterium]|nr:integration host factor subunit beta [Candidatus Kapabacteria bacterium]
MGTETRLEYCIADHEAVLNVTKADIVDKIASETGLTKLETKAVVDGFLLSIIDALAAGNRIELRGFGVFSVKSRKPRMARNPRTGDPVPLEERFIPAFKVSSEFQEKVHDKIKSANDVKTHGG